MDTSIEMAAATGSGIEPGSPTGMKIGYARVSTAGQLLDRQISALRDAGCVRIFTDKKSGRTADREALSKALDYLRPGDVLVVASLDRLGRSLQDLIAIVAGLRRQEVGFTSLHEALDTTTPGGRLVFHVFAALAEFIRELIVQGTRARAAPGPAPGAYARAGGTGARLAGPAEQHRDLDRPPAGRVALDGL